MTNKRKLLALGCALASLSAVVCLVIVLWWVFWRPWSEVKVSPGPGSAVGEVYPCKVLSNYEPLFPHGFPNGFGVVGLLFRTTRDGDTIQTTIWSPKVDVGIVVDWTKEEVSRAGPQERSNFLGVCPGYDYPGLHLSGGRGELYCGQILPWRKGVVCYTILVAPDEPVWFGNVYTDAQSPTLESVICASPSPSAILGEIKMPASKTILWYSFDKQQRVLYVIEAEWRWIALIDLARSPAVKATRP